MRYITVLLLAILSISIASAKGKTRRLGEKEALDILQPVFTFEQHKKFKERFRKARQADFDIRFMDKPKRTKQQKAPSTRKPSSKKKKGAR